MTTTENSNPDHRSQHSMLAIAHELERKLEQVDAMGVHIAAAHIDAAITRLRIEAHEELVE